VGLLGGGRVGVDAAELDGGSGAGRGTAGASVSDRGGGVRIDPHLDSVAHLWSMYKERNNTQACSLDICDPRLLSGVLAVKQETDDD
jgi:hypothetical protein